MFNNQKRVKDSINNLSIFYNVPIYRYTYPKELFILSVIILNIILQYIDTHILVF